MIKQIFLITVRSFLKDKLLSFINISNLAIGFATFILISLFIKEEFNWNKNNKNYDRIYRVQLFMDQSKNVTRNTWSVPAALSRHILPDIPEIEKIALIHDVGDNNKNVVFLSADKKRQFLTKYGYWADQSVFDIFTFIFLKGTPDKALEKPFSIVLSKTLAKQLFPAGNALGGKVLAENKFVLTVTGVYEDFPDNSTWRPNYILPMNTYSLVTKWEDYENNYWVYTFYTYLLLKENARPEAVDNKISGVLKDYRKEHHPYLRPMSQFHINPYLENNFYGAQALLLFIALLILSLSSFNFINLQTANATNRLREIGVKKTVGFSRKTLRMQFIFESVLISMFAGFIAFILAELALPFFNRMAGFVIIPHVFSNPLIDLIAIVIIGMTGFVSALYPSFVISTFNPVTALKLKYILPEKRGFSLKKILVTFQFSITIFMVILSFIIYRQANYMVNKDMGFNSHNILFANIITYKKGSFDELRQKLLKHPEIADACVSDCIPFVLPGGNDLTWEGAKPDDKVFIRYYNVSYDFFATYQIKVIEGRNFSRQLPGDTAFCLINETAAKVFGWDKPLGQHIKVINKEIEVIGVVKDFIASSVFMQIEPHMYLLQHENTNLNNIFSVRFNPGDFADIKRIVANEFGQFFPDDVVEFIPIQSIIQNEEVYKTWKEFRNIIIFFTLLSILISSVGLFGLVMFFSKQKMKEIGIRKVLGFSVGRLYLKLLSEFIGLMLISLIISWPIAWYIYKLLPGAYKYPLGIWEFLLATGIVLAVAVSTISYHIIKSIYTSPAEILKYE